MESQPLFDLGDFTVALAAALLAFAFFLAGELLIRAYQLYWEHHTALLRLQVLLNSSLQAIEINKMNIDKMDDIVRRGRRIINMPRKFRLGDERVLVDVVDVQIQSDYFDFRELVTTWNEYVDNFSAYYETVYARFIDGQLDHNEFVSQSLSVLGGFTNLRRNLDAMRNDLLNLAAKTRIRVAEPKSTAALAVEWVLFKLMMSPDPPELSKERVQETRRQLESEIAERPA